MSEQLRRNILDTTLEETDQVELLEEDDEDLDAEIETRREELAAIEAEHKARIKDEKRTPEEHLESSLRIGELRAELRDLEAERDRE